MGIYYHVSRTNTLSEGLILSLEKLSTGDNFSQSHLDALYSEGLSHFGDQYLLRGAVGTNKNNLNEYFEILFEWVRRAEFPNMPSRLQSLFGCETVEEARRFVSLFPTYTPNDPKNSSAQTIWEVECEKAEKLDMSFLNGGRSILTSVGFARNYWAKGQGPEPRWEVLMVPPIRVLRRVE